MVQLKNGLHIVDLSPFTHVFLVDDVISSGTHYKVCKDLILTDNPEIEVVGIFCAKTLIKE